MAGLRESCGQLEKVLADVHEACRATLDKVDAFEVYITRCAALALTCKLAILALCIDARRQDLYQYHGVKGYVFVVMSESEGMYLYWVEKAKIVADRGQYAARGFTIESVEEAIQLICKAIVDLHSGKWAAVLDWFRKYGRSPGLDIEECLRIAGWRPG